MTKIASALTGNACPWPPLPLDQPRVLEIIVTDTGCVTLKDIVIVISVMPHLTAM